MMKPKTASARLSGCTQLIVSLCGPNVTHADDLVLAMKLGDDLRLPPHLTGAAGGDVRCSRRRTNVRPRPI